MDKLTEVESRMAVAKEEGEGRMTPVCQVQKLYTVSLSLYFSFELEMEPRVSCLVGRHGSTEPCCTLTRNSPGVLQLGDCRGLTQLPMHLGPLKAGLSPL